MPFYVSPRDAFPCPGCPWCGRPPVFFLWPEQAFCATDECDALIWDMTKTRQENLDDAHEVDIERGSVRRYETPPGE